MASGSLGSDNGDDAAGPVFRMVADLTTLNETYLAADVVIFLTTMHRDNRSIYSASITLTLHRRY